MANQSNDRLRGYRVEIDFMLPSGDGVLLRESRTRIATLMLTVSEQRDLQELDEMALEMILDHEDLQPYLLEDSKDYPLTQWWWHLGQLRAGTYPAHLLPPALRVIYQPLV
ncbi:MAG: hypothetical protein QG599_559 [Pseudomonadota bacterium]|nr:hypothetical protein [Pseudomonadota bacterium]